MKANRKLHKNGDISVTIRLLIIMFLLFLSACSKNGDKRAKLAEKGKGDIVVGAAFSMNDTRHFLEGFELAIDDLNRKGGVLGRKIRVIVKDDESFQEENAKYLIRRGKAIAREFANNPNVVAVVGHNDSNVAVPVSLIYEKNKIVFITPYATTPSLTTHGFRFVFRTLPTDTDYARKLAMVAKQKFKSVLIISVDDLYGETLSNNFHTFAENLGIEIVGDIHISPYDKDIKSEIIRRANLIEGKKFDEKFDSIFLASEMPTAAFIIKMARDLNVTGPFLGGDALDTINLIKIAGKDATEGTIICTIIFKENSELQAFRERFHKKYLFSPNPWAAQAYDTMMILAYAMEAAGTTVPKKVSETLHFIQDWKGITGVFTFDEKGDILDNFSGFKVVHNGKIEYDAELTKLIEDAEMGDDVFDKKNSVYMMRQQIDNNADNDDDNDEYDPDQ